MSEAFTKLNLIDKAIIVATRAHDGQTRKASGIPYIVHPYAVAMLAKEYTDDTEIIAACLLHDVLEDVKPEIYSKQNMIDDFGETITNLVEIVSEPKTAGEVERPWRERKDAYLARITEAREHGDKRALMISGADKICNMNSILEDYAIMGEKVWDKFSATKDYEIWWYQACGEAIRSVLPAKMMELYDELFAKIAEAAK